MQYAVCLQYYCSYFFLESKCVYYYCIFMSIVVRVIGLGGGGLLFQSFVGTFGNLSICTCN